jgi:hypothetical protein
MYIMAATDIRRTDTISAADNANDRYRHRKRGRSL